MMDDHFPWIDRFGEPGNQCCIVIPKDPLRVAGSLNEHFRKADLEGAVLYAALHESVMEEKLRIALDKSRLRKWGLDKRWGKLMDLVRVVDDDFKKHYMTEPLPGTPGLFAEYLQHPSFKNRVSYLDEAPYFFAKLSIAGSHAKGNLVCLLKEDPGAGKFWFAPIVPKDKYEGAGFRGPYWKERPSEYSIFNHLILRSERNGSVPFKKGSLHRFRMEHSNHKRDSAYPIDELVRLVPVPAEKGTRGPYR